MGSRYETGCDFFGYMLRFERLYENFDLPTLIGSHEAGFHLLNALIKKIGLDYVWLNLAASLIYLICVFRFARLSPRPLLLIALFFPILLVQLGMSGLRQALAVGFLLMALVQFVEKKRLLSAGWILVAAQFHSSAFVFLPLAVLAGREVSVAKIAGALIVIGPLAGLLLSEEMEMYSARYIEQVYGENSSSGAFFRYIVACIPAVLFEFRKKRVKAAFPETYEMFRVFSLATFAMILVFPFSTVVFHRLLYYLLPVSLLMFVSVTMVLPQRTKISGDFLAIPVLVLGVYMIGWFSLSRHADYCYVPYQTYLLKQESS